MKENKKIAVLTWYADTINYGSILQAYALQECLYKFGYDATFINYKSKISDLEYFSMLHNILQKVVKRLLIFKNKKELNLEESIKACKEFVDNFIKSTPKLIGRKELTYMNKIYDIFVCGSDQIWSLNKKFNPCNFLNWVDKNKVKIAYAPSIPLEHLTKKKRAFLERYIYDFKALSVRESNSAQILSEIIKQPVVSVLDPTLLVEREFWFRNISDCIENASYILCYLLGDRDYYYPYIEKTAKDNGLKIVVIPTSRKIYSDKYIVKNGVGPFDFINLIRQAEFVFTDSYHATIFSYIFHKKFYLFERFNPACSNSQNSRIYDLTSKLRLESRIINKSGMYISYDEIDYSISDEHYNFLRKESIEFLESALDMHAWGNG